MSASERREAVLAAAMVEFAQGGFAGTSTEAIARRVGVSQPYLFRLFPTKKAIFLAACERCFDQVEQTFAKAVEGRHGVDALRAMGRAYDSLLTDRQMLLMQLQTWALACQDEEVREVSRARFRRLWGFVQRRTGLSSLEVMRFISTAMLLNVVAALGLPSDVKTLAESFDQSANASIERSD